jgi:hypothetical protein
VVLDVLLHLLPGHHEVVVPAVHLVVPLGPRRVCRTTEPPLHSSPHLGEVPLI